VRDYQLTPEQMALLVDSGHVVPHLYEARKLDDYAAPHLRPLFRNTDRWYANSVRLGKLRAHLKLSIPTPLQDYKEFTPRILSLIELGVCARIRREHSRLANASHGNATAREGRNAGV